MTMSEGTSAAGTRIIEGLAEISADYDLLLCDLWGCLHNGLEPYPAAVAALEAFRARGGIVVLLTNAPRENRLVIDGLRRMGAPDSCWDAAISSGDATREAMAEGAAGRRVHVIGPARDEALWQGLGLERADLAAAEFILCSGLVDDSVETPEDYTDVLTAGVDRGLPMLCANPDLVVDRGETRLYCAGALAAEYSRLGGEARYFGKPHAPIYRLAVAAAERLAGRSIPTARILGVGDGVITDVPGAAAMGFDCLFVGGGLAAPDLGPDPETPDPHLLAQYLASHTAAPRYTIGRLR